MKKFWKSVLSHKALYFLKRKRTKQFDERYVIFNTSRGKLAEGDAIIEGLKAKKISGYLADDLTIEPIEPNEKLIGVENVIITPHVDSRTFQSVERQGLIAVNNLIKMING